jgi:hypothetical protein
MGAPALLPLIELERRPLPPDLAARVINVRSGLFDRLADDQAHWWSWTPHGATRLARAQSLLGPLYPRTPPLPPTAERHCDGTIHQP